MLTGRHQSRFGHEENPSNDADPALGLPLSERTLADYLRGAGYVTGHVGKWHLGHHLSRAPHARGFMESVSVEGCFESVAEQAAFAEQARQLFPTRGKYAGFYRNNVPEPTGGYVADRLADEAVAFVDRHHAAPFFLYWAHPFPHVPQIAEEKYLARVAHIADEPRRVYAAMMLAVDDGVGRLLAALRQHGIADQTLIFYMSDNGGPSDGRLPCFNTPFTGNKGGMKEGGIRVPYFVQWPAGLRAGTVYDRPVSTLDIVPTALAAAGVPLPADVSLDGVNLLPYWRGERTGDPHPQLFWRYSRRGIWAIREGDWKLMQSRGKVPSELYHLGQDPSESHNLAAAEPARVQSLQALYNAWSATLPAPLWENTRDTE
jgi:arylsulfatase A-like enzyme